MSKKKLTSVMLNVSTAVLISGAVSLVPMVASAALTEAQIQSILSLLTSFGADTSTINNVNSSLRGLPTSGTPTPSAGACTFTRNLTVGSRGDDVTCLQSYLGVTPTTGYFGPLTKAAVANWQAANGVAPAVGYFGALSRAKYSALVASIPPGTTPPGTTPPSTLPTAGTLKVESGVQPAATLFPINSTRVPFTVVKFTAPSSGDVTVSSLVVERTGLANDTAFSGVVLLDESGTQIGIAKTLNSLHQASLTGSFVVKAGQTRTMSLAGNAETSSNSLAGQVPYLKLVSVTSNASAVDMPASGITGTGHTVNESLTIGTVTMQRGSLDPGASATKKVGTTDYAFSSVKVTVGSAEKVYLKFIKWNQTGSAASGDLANLKTYVDGTAYDMLLSTDGKYYLATFGDNNGKGILIDKGFSKEATVKGDLVGGSGRTVDFDLAKRVDVGLVGENYGFGITPPQTGASDPTDDSANFSSTEDPWYDAAQVTIDTGSITASAAASLTAQNIAVNLANQPLGAFDIEVKGEEISVGRMIFHINTTGTGHPGQITNITLVDSDGAVVAGPADGSRVVGGDGTVTFTDTINFKVGKKTYTLKGKLATNFVSNDTVQASTTPSSNWTTVTGLTTSNSITPSPTSAITSSVMTVKAGALAVSVSSVPIAQTIIAGAQNFLFANYILNATASGEDVRLTNMRLSLNAGGASAAATHVTGCILYDGATAVTSSKDPSSAASTTAFTFSNNGYTVPKGTSKTLALKCNLSTSASGQYHWGLDGTQANSTNWTGVSGLTSGQTIAQTVTDNTGPIMTSASGGSLAVSIPNNPPYAIVGAGQTGVVLARIRYSATNEPIDLRQVALVMGRAASNTVTDLVGSKVTLWTTEGVQIAEAQFDESTDRATSSPIASGAFTIPRDGYKELVVKGDIAGISASGPLTKSGDYLTVNYDGNNRTAPAGNYGVGTQSNVNGASGINGSAAANSSGVRIMRAYPNVAVNTSGLSTTINNGGDQKLYRYSVTASNGDVHLYKMRFAISSSSLMATTSLYSLYAYTDSGFANLDTAFSATGLINAGQCFNGSVTTSAGPRQVAVFPDKTGCNTATTTYVVPSGVTRYFELRATAANVSGVTTSKDSISVNLEGDSAYPVPSGNASGNMNAATIADTGVLTSTAFIWSPASTSTNPLYTDEDFTNGYGIIGLPAVGTASFTLQSP